MKQLLRGDYNPLVKGAFDMMKVRSTLVLVVAGLAGAASVGALAQAPAKKPAAAATPAPSHVMVAAADLKWGPAPPAMPPGAQAAVIAGDPSQAGSAFVMRAKLPDGYKVPPHWLPSDENVTVLSGTFVAGMGETMNEASMKALAPGGFVRLAKKAPHYAMAKGETIIQIHGTGPFEITYVNPNDDPRKKATTGAK
jgi:hypothetical protein